MSLSPMEITLVLAVLVLLFGAKKIPELARSLGRASQEFKKAKEDFIAEAKKPAEEIAEALRDSPRPPDSAAPVQSSAEESVKG